VSDIFAVRAVREFCGAMSGEGDEGTVDTGADAGHVDFVFEDWAKGAGLKRNTAGFLRTEDLITEETLTLIDPGDLAAFPLTVGQRKLLGLAITQLKPMVTPEGPPPDVAVPEGAGQQEVTINDIRNQVTELASAGKGLDELLNQGKSTPMPPVSAAAVSHTGFDPRSILTLKSAIKTIHITQFISEKTRKRRISRRREVIVPSVDHNGDRVVVQREDTQPYSGIYQTEWGAANCRLMHHLLSTGLLARQDIEYYLAYTAKIFDLSDRYEWESILEYDFLYRERQTQHKFPWGTLAPDMELHVLIAKNRAQSSGSHAQSAYHDRASSGGTGGGASHPPTGECKLFKARGTCPFGDGCRYRHVKQPSTNSASATKND
jgi:hypothetical protein